MRRKVEARASDHSRYGRLPTNVDLELRCYPVSCLLVILAFIFWKSRHSEYYIYRFSCSHENSVREMSSVATVKIMAILS